MHAWLTSMCSMVYVARWLGMDCDAEVGGDYSFEEGELRGGGLFEVRGPVTK